MKHSDTTKNHKIENWTYADEAARTGATGLVSADIGKVAYQSDTKVYYRLENHSPVTWGVIGSGGGSGGGGESFTYSSTVTPFPSSPVEPVTFDGIFRFNELYVGDSTELYISAFSLSGASLIAYFAVQAIGNIIVIKQNNKVVVAKVAALPTNYSDTWIKLPVAMVFVTDAVLTDGTEDGTDFTVEFHGPAAQPLYPTPAVIADLGGDEWGVDGSLGEVFATLFLGVDSSIVITSMANGQTVKLFIDSGGSVITFATSIASASIVWLTPGGTPPTLTSSVDKIEFTRVGLVLYGAYLAGA